MKKTSFPVPPPPFEPIHARAYHLWQQANQPTGQDMHFWLQAEQQALTQVQVAQQPQAGKAAASIKTTVSAKPSPTTAKATPPQALTFKPTPKAGRKRSTKPPAR